MSPDRIIKLGPMPRERDYPDTPLGATEFARDTADWLRSYIDITDDRVRLHDVDLQPPTSARPGWVARELASLAGELVRQKEQQAEDNKAVMEEAKRVRGYLKAAIITSGSAIVSLASFLAGQLIMGR